MAGGMCMTDVVPNGCTISGTAALNTASTNQNGAKLVIRAGNAATQTGRTGTGGILYLSGGSKSPSGTARAAKQHRAKWFDCCR